MSIEEGVPSPQDMSINPQQTEQGAAVSEGTEFIVGGKNKTPEISRPENHIIRYGDPRLDAELARWKESDQKDQPLEFPTFSDGERQVVLVGTAHRYDAKAPMVKSVTLTVQKYAESNPGGVVIVEGFHDSSIPHRETFDMAVRVNGEMGAAVHVAQESGVEVLSGEIPRNQVVEQLKQQGITEDQIATFYLLRDLPNLMRTQQLSAETMAGLAYEQSQQAGAHWAESLKPDEERQMREDVEFRQEKSRSVLTAALPRLNEVAKDTLTKWYAALDDEGRAGILAGTHGSDQAEQAVYQQLLKTGETMFLDPDFTVFRQHENGIESKLDADTITYLTNPGNEAPDTNFRKISRIDNEARDKFLLARITEAAQDGKKPLIVYGGTHAIKIAPALAQLYPKSAGK